MSRKTILQNFINPENGHSRYATKAFLLKNFAIPLIRHYYSIFQAVGQGVKEKFFVKTGIF